MIVGVGIRDDSWKIVLFENIFDENFTSSERAVLFVILRKTIYMDRLWKRIPSENMMKKSGLGVKTFKKVVNELIEKKLINIKRSVGGRNTVDPEMIFNAYSLGDLLINQADMSLSYDL